MLLAYPVHPRIPAALIASGLSAESAFIYKSPAYPTTVRVGLPYGLATSSAGELRAASRKQPSEPSIQT